MESRNSEALNFERREIFSDKCKFCKIFEATDKRQSGDIPHFHDYTQIWYITRGCCEHWVDGRKYSLLRGECFLMPPGITHLTILHPDSSIICCEVALEALFPNDNEALPKTNVYEQVLSLSFLFLFMREARELRTQFRMSPHAELRMEALMREMLHEYTHEFLYFEENLYLLIQMLILLLVREYTAFPKVSEMMKEYEKYKSMVEIGISYMHEHYAEPLTLKQVSQVSMMSRTYFCQIFKMITQKTFKEYLIELRIHQAVERIHNTQEPITDISQAVGFSDSAHFSRTFKKIMGLAPREYRALHAVGPKGN
ncbi:MAG: helix-turn-helix transcriptional regulator [Clostridiales bacterium]|nr:helix-turn-helix transcriptional regulator [Clostridiales bacterium]